MIQFKSERQQREWNDGQLGPKLIDIMNMVNLYSELVFNKSIVITDIYRTQKEQDDIYYYNQDYQKKPWKSVHQYWRGVDIRSSIYDEEEIKELVKLANKVTYDPARPDKKTSLYHTVGSGLHVHFQTM